jgi:hypothetical protein
MIAYLIIAYAVPFVRTRTVHLDSEILVFRSFNSATFASSVLLLLGVADPVVLHAIGDVRPFLAFAAIFGFGYTVRSLLV